ncbi:MAG: DUF3108 domain-containing protein, partial [Bacteroidales bacterium]|nr:DUF3108 domain-containing protein [Bacteroidales bacterium]
MFKKSISFIIFFAAVIITNLYAQKKEKPYQPGETLRYEMSYGWITGGEASLSLKKEKFNGKPVYHVSAIGKTIGLTHVIYHVYDRYESWFDVTSGLPYKSLTDLTEGNWKKFNIVYFNQDSHSLKSKLSGEKKLDKNIFDVVSAFYYVRESIHGLKPGQVFEIYTYFHDKPWNMIIRYKGVETIKTDLGKIECMKFKPVVEKGTFKDEE